MTTTRNRYLRRPIVCVETGVLYESITAAAAKTGTSQPSISRAIHADTPFKLAAGGSHWATLDRIAAIGGIDVAKELVAQKRITRRMLRDNPGNGIRCVETGRRYASISEASRKLNIPWAHIKTAIDSNSTLKGCHWENI